MSKKGLKLFRLEELEVMSDPERTFRVLITRNRKYPNSENYVIRDFEAFQEITLNYIGHSVHSTQHV